MGNDKIHLYKLTCNCPYCRQLRFLNERMLAEGKVELNTPEEIRKEVTPSRKELTNKVVFEPIASGGKTVYTPTSIVSKKEQLWNNNHRKAVQNSPLAACCGYLTEYKPDRWHAV